MTDSVEEMSNVVKLSENDIKEAIVREKEYFTELTREIKSQEEELKKLKKVFDGATPGHPKVAAQKAFEEQRKSVGQLRKGLEETEVTLQDLNKRLVETQKNALKWTEVATGINQGIELIQKATNGLKFSVDVANLTRDVQRMTDLTGRALDEYVSKSRTLADVYEKDASDVAKTVHIMTKQLGGSYESNFALLESGFKRGADLSGGLLSSLEKYSGTLASMGVSGADAIALMTKAAKDGLNPEDAIESVKNAGMALTEMGVKQEKALAGIGIKVEDLAGKTTWEAVQMVSKAMEGMSTQARQTVLARVFSTSGKESGLAFIEGLASGMPDLESMPEVEAAGSGFKKFFSEMQTWAGQAFGNIGIYAQELSPMIQLIAGAIPIIQMLSKVTWLQSIATKVVTVAQWLWNAAMTANPIGIIILAVGALIGIITWLISSTEGWGEAWEHTWNGAKNLFQAWISTIKAHWGLLVNGLMIGINKIQEGWYKFKEAVGLGDSEENQRMLQQIQEDTESRKKAIVEGYAEAAEYGKKAADDFGKAIGSIKWKEKKEEEQPSINEYATANPERLSFDPESKKGKGKKEGNGLNVGSGSGGIKSITMTLNITNQFSVSKGTDMRSIADKIVGHVNDRLRDSVINLGA